jgi:pimeloyl-ACP methyl ester carboxylesterase
MRDDEFVAMIKSTSVRSNRSGVRAAVPGALRAALRLTSALAPALAARWGERRFLTPPRRRPAAAESAALATARRGALAAAGTAIATWQWGEGGPTVLLVHGWGGRGGQLAAFVGPLRARGYSVVAFDAPGHGATSAGPTTLPQMLTAMRAVAAAHGPVHALLAHSLGATVAARALHEGLAARAAVFVGAPANLTGPSVHFAAAVGLSPTARQLMQRRIEARVGVPWSAFDVRSLGAGQVVPLLVVHDRDDAEVPWQDGALLAQTWPGAQRLDTEGLGHRRVLRDPEVVAAAVRFIDRHAMVQPAPVPRGERVAARAAAP